jgi:hypothetical protein
MIVLVMFIDYDVATNVSFIKEDVLLCNLPIQFISQRTRCPHGLGDNSSSAEVCFVPIY